MKGQYNIYPTLTEISIRRVRQKHGKKISAQDALRFLIREVPNLLQSINYSILAEEHYWLEKSRVVIFPETAEILEKLTQAKFNIEHVAGINMPHDCFILAFPKDFMIKDVQANSCMISYLDSAGRMEHLHKPFLKYIKAGKSHVTEKYDRGLYISYMNPYEKNSVVRMNVPSYLLADCLMAESATEYVKLVGHFETKDAGTIKLNQHELEYQFALYQIVVRVGIYSTACDALRSGYPHVRPKHLEPKGISYVDQTLGLTSETRTVGMHYRSWHFRQLTNERYYRGEYANKPIGSRVVFVKDSMIGKNIEAETLV